MYTNASYVVEKKNRKELHNIQLEIVPADILLEHKHCINPIGTGSGIRSSILTNSQKRKG